MILRFAAVRCARRAVSARMPYQIMYSSQATEPMTVMGLEEILTDARAGNQARNVTGALIYVDGVFFQIIEGDKDVVRNLMASIASDSRHHSVKVFYEAEVDVRAFASWSMAYLSPTAEQMSKWAGLPGTATVEELLADINRVPRILVNIMNALAQ
jgi:Sensors of blue-light using FAD